MVFIVYIAWVWMCWFIIWNTFNEYFLKYFSSPFYLEIQFHYVRLFSDVSKLVNSHLICFVFSLCYFGYFLLLCHQINYTHFPAIPNLLLILLKFFKIFQFFLSSCCPWFFPYCPHSLLLLTSSKISLDVICHEFHLVKCWVLFYSL